MKTALLIINYNDAETTEKLIRNVEEYSCLDIVLVLDNCSTDDSFSYLKKKYMSDKIAVIQSEANKGYAYAMNYGCKYLIERLGDCNVIVSNSDIIIYDETDLIKLIASKSEGVAIVAPIVEGHNEESKGWKIPTPLQESLLNIIYIHRFLESRFLEYKMDYYQDKSMVEVEVILGCFFLIDTRYLQEVGFYDEHTFLYYEENIMARKLQSINAKTMVNTEVKVFHNHSVTIDKAFNKLNKLRILKESQYYFQKNYNGAGIMSRMALRITQKTNYQLFKVIYGIQDRKNKK